MTLAQLGWSAFWQSQFQSYRQRGLMPARVIGEHRHAWTVCGEGGEMLAEVLGRLRYGAQGRGDLPAVGDWVAIQCQPGAGPAMVHAVLPRRSKFSRKVAGGSTDEQVLAANVDTVFLVCGLDGDFNLRRIERYVPAMWDSGANPVILLNKADLCDQVHERIAEVESVAPGVSVHAVSAAHEQGLEALGRYVAAGKSVVVLGSSGVGKSTLINRLLGVDRQQTGGLRRGDGKGRHTTTSRELIVLPAGGILIDTPGMRQLQLWSDGEGLEETFDDVEEVARGCRFRDCRHAGEPGCAVQQALADGTLDAGRWENYLKLQREVRFLASRQDQRIREEQKARWKQIAKFQRQQGKHRF